jgi:glycosyltransferase involved in cell wall biosynthesis
MIEPEFSIITPTCKRHILLRRAIRSMMAQSFGNFEVIVVDDSPEEHRSHETVRSFNDNRIVYIRHESNRGAASAYNTGIRAARGPWICFLDDDDEYFPSFLQRTSQALQSNSKEVGFVWTGVRRVKDTPEGEVLWYERNWTKPFLTKEEAYLGATSIGNGFGLTVKRTCFGIVGLYDESFKVCEDTELLFRLARHFKCAVIPEILVKIHSHQNSQLTQRSNFSLRLELYEEILRRNLDLLDKYPELKEMHSKVIVDLSYQLAMYRKGRQILLSLIRNRPFSLRNILDLICYELFKHGAAHCWGESRTRGALRNAANRLRARPPELLRS